MIVHELICDRCKIKDQDNPTVRERRVRLEAPRGSRGTLIVRTELCDECSDELARVVAHYLDRQWEQLS
jgi:hypothetical protein